MSPREPILYKVIVSAKGEYQVWPVSRENPLGWRDIGRTGTQAECLEHIKKMRK